MTNNSQKSDSIINVIYSAFEELTPIIQNDVKFDKNIKTKIMNQLDSLEMVNFIVFIERALEKKFSKTVSLYNINDIEPSSSPFQNVETLSNYIEELL